MMRPVRLIAAALLLVAAAWALREFVVVPDRCNKALKLAKLRISAAARQPTFRTMAGLRENDQTMVKTCNHWCGTRADALVVWAQNERLLGHEKEARTIFHRALETEQRADIYAMIGTFELETGHPDRAIEAYRAAASYSGYWLYQIPDAAVTEDVRRRLDY